MRSTKLHGYFIWDSSTRIILYHYNEPTIIPCYCTKAKILVFIVLGPELFCVHINVIETNARDWRPKSHSKNSAFFVMQTYTEHFDHTKGWHPQFLHRVWKIRQKQTETWQNMLNMHSLRQRRRSTVVTSNVQKVMPNMTILLSHTLKCKWQTCCGCSTNLTSSTAQHFDLIRTRLGYGPIQSRFQKQAELGIVNPPPLLLVGIRHCHCWCIPSKDIWVGFQEVWVCVCWLRLIGIPLDWTPLWDPGGGNFWWKRVEWYELQQIML